MKQLIVAYLGCGCTEWYAAREYLPAGRPVGNCGRCGKPASTITATETRTVESSSADLHWAADVTPEPPALLQQAADALNACRRAGLHLRVRHGALQCDEGLILDLPDGTWAPRTRAYTEFTPPAGDDLDE